MQNLTLQAILSPTVITVAPDTPLTEVLTSMESLHLSCMVAVDDDRRPLGIFTDQDVIRLMAETSIVHELKMADVMNTVPLTATSNTDFRSAYHLISEKGFRHLIVVDAAGRLEGVINETDFLHMLGLEFLIELKTVGDVMTRNVQTIVADAVLSEAVNLMASQQAHSVIVMRDDLPAGVLTEHDMISLARKIGAPSAVNLTSVMNAPVQTIPADTSLKMAAQKMEETGVRQLVVIEHGNISGLVTHHDIVKATQGHCIEFLHETLERQRRDLLDAHSIIEQTRQQLLLRSLMEQINDAVYVVDVNSGRILDANNEASVSLGHSHEELLQLSIFDVSAHVRPGSEWHAFLHRFSASGQQIFESQMRRRDGSEFPVEMNARLLQRDNHDYVVAVARDLTNLRQQETQLRLQLAALNASANAIVLTDRNAVIQWSNQAFSDMTGYSASEAIGKHPNELIRSGVQTREFYAALWKTILSGQVWRGEVVNKRKDGTLYQEEMTITPVRDENREITHFVAVKQDITARKEAERAVQESHDQLNALIEAIPDAIFFKDGESRWLITNETAKKLFHLHGFDWQGKTEMELAAARPEFRVAHESCRIDDEKAWEAGKLSLFEERVADESGHVREFEVRKVPLFGPENERKGLVIIGRDISERKQTEEQLREAAAVMQSTHEGVVICDATPKIIAINAAYTDITGYSAPEVIGQHPKVFSSGHSDLSFHDAIWKNLLRDGHWQGEVWNRRKSGEVYPQLLTISTVYDDQHLPMRYVGVFADISQLKENQAQLEFMALHDPLTKLPNRSLVEQRLKQEIELAHRHKHHVGVLFIDLDRFKLVNDSFGHLVGDELLCDVSTRLNARLREGDTLGRLGGDEFILLVSPLRDSQDAAIVARDFISVLSAPFQLPDGHEVFIGGSIGISLFPQDGETVSELMKNADAAMYLAKESGRNQYSFYSKELNADARSRLTMENDLRRAVLQNELMLHYQPIVDLRTGKICGAEALARWRQGNNQWISPTKFIPLSEKSGVILMIGNWVINQACMQIRKWLDEGLANVRVAINISARQFRSGNLDKLVAQALKKYNISAQHLELELTESMLMHEHDEAVATMQKLKQIGVKISLDDFGTGYSSFSYLSRFPIDTLKIDQSFVRNVVIERDATEIASAIIGLAHRMGLRVVAEGVETEAQLAYLRENGCDEIQGYRFSTPLTPQDFADLLRSGKTLPNPEETCPARHLLIVSDKPDILKDIELSLHDEDYCIHTADGSHAGLESLALNQAQVILVKQHPPGMDGPDFLSRAREINPHSIRILLADQDDNLATLSQAVNSGTAGKLLTHPIAEDHLRKHVLEAFAAYEAATEKSGHP
ncbi:MAG TPA: EAL domain-containing protein [Gallionella sp.]|nr:EAL domain-containing protein [Gallionella sp.]